MVAKSKKKLLLLMFKQAASFTDKIISLTVWPKQMQRLGTTSFPFSALTPALPFLSSPPYY